MWDDVAARLPEYASAVLTARDADGYPFSFRCHPEPDAAACALRVRVPPEAPVRPGPASLLCHKHDEWLWNQRSFLTRGLLIQDREGWAFRPLHLVPGMGTGGALGQLRFLLGARRATRRYLAARGLPRPQIPWNELIAVKKRAQVNLAARRALGAPFVDAAAPAHLDPPPSAEVAPEIMRAAPNQKQQPAPRLGLTLLVGVGLLLMSAAALWWWRGHRDA